MGDGKGGLNVIELNAAAIVLDELGYGDAAEAFRDKANEMFNEVVGLPGIPSPRHTAVVTAAVIEPKGVLPGPARHQSELRMVKRQRDRYNRELLVERTLRQRLQERLGEGSEGHRTNPNCPYPHHADDCDCKGMGGGR